MPAGDWFCPACEVRGAAIADLENEAVTVRWGRGEKAAWHNAVVSEVRASGKAPRVRVQFDATLEHAWVGATSVRVMAEADEGALPPWLRVGRPIEARDPVGDAGKAVRWHGATLEEARRGLESDWDGERCGLRLWVKYAASGLCQWLRREHVREVGGGGEAASASSTMVGSGGGGGDGTARSPGKSALKSPGASPKQRTVHWADAPAASSAEAAAATPERSAAAVAVGGGSRRRAASADQRVSVTRLSRPSGVPGCDLWLLLDAPRPADATFTLHFGQLAAVSAACLAPNLLSCTVPEVARGEQPLRLEMALHGGRRVPCALGDACTHFELVVPEAVD